MVDTGCIKLSRSNFVIGQNLGQDVCFREKYDVAVARAVAEMRILGRNENLFVFSTLKTGSLLCGLLIWGSAEYCLPLVRVGGLFVAAKGHDPQVCIWFCTHQPTNQPLALLKSIIFWMNKFISPIVC